MIMKVTFWTVVFTVLFSSGMAFGQSCPGSFITYVLRDHKGRAVEPATSDIKVGDAGGASSSQWRTSSNTFMRWTMNPAPEEITKLKGKISSFLQTSAMCNFREPVSLRLVRNGKTMEITFIVPRLGTMDSRSFLVDGAPFKPGKYSVTLTADRAFYDRRDLRKDP
jgi:hypothetical protein